MLIDQLGFVTMNDYPPIKTFICSNFSDKHQKMMTWLRHLKREPTPRSRNPLRPHTDITASTNPVFREYGVGPARLQRWKRKKMNQNKILLAFDSSGFAGVVTTFATIAAKLPAKMRSWIVQKPAFPGFCSKMQVFFEIFRLEGRQL
ncbi:hypothetical protein JAU75_00440 [Ochrobactrum sp. Q0168]|uniref:hypothetical protein n=1 Tax=Ochrobactrum sp. Q0168 TaxID=2793241 RepID=UPI0018EAFC19|nr:hypothetical protein [Ochrobactrum sp. Q0168]